MTSLRLALCHLYNLATILGSSVEMTNRLLNLAAAKIAGGGRVTERRARPHNDACPAQLSTPECDESNNSVECRGFLAPRFFLRQATHVSCAVHNRMNQVFSYAFCLFVFIQNHVAVGKRKTKRTKERAVQAACTTASTERRGHRTAHFAAARIPVACTYFRALRRMRLARGAVVRYTCTKIQPKAR